RHHAVRQGGGCSRSCNFHCVRPRHLAAWLNHRSRRRRDPGAVISAPGAFPAVNILLTPARIGSIEIPNRIVMPPMTTRTADEEGFVTDDTVAYYMARVDGGTGLITVEMAAPERAGRHRPREIGIYDDRFLPGLTRRV